MIQGTSISWIDPRLIFVAADRHRRTFKQTDHDELKRSIRLAGMIQPIVVDIDGTETIRLIAGERRLRASMELLAETYPIRLTDGTTFVGCVPAIVLREQSQYVREQIELHENIQRVNLTWQEKVQATERMARLIQQAEPDLPAEKLPGEILERLDLSAHVTRVAGRLVLADFMHLPQVVGAPTEGDARKNLTRYLENQFRAKLALEVLKAQVSDDSPGGPATVPHILLHGDALELLPQLDRQFDVVVTDPPYGIGADSYSHNENMPIRHLYDDSRKTLARIMTDLPMMLTARTKQDAHLYLFCDFTMWAEWRSRFEKLEWSVYDRPIIWNKGRGPSGSPDLWPMAFYETVLFARKGKRPLQAIRGNVVSIPPVEGRLHAAQKPVDLYVDLLSRSTLTGDLVLDPFSGSGTIFEAADRLNLEATGIESDKEAFGLCQRRLAGEKESGQ